MTYTGGAVEVPTHCCPLCNGTVVRCFKTRGGLRAHERGEEHRARVFIARMAAEGMSTCSMPTRQILQGLGARVVGGPTTIEWSTGTRRRSKKPKLVVVNGFWVPRTYVRLAVACRAAQRVPRLALAAYHAASPEAQAAVAALLHLSPLERSFDASQRPGGSMQRRAEAEELLAAAEILLGVSL